MPDPISYGVILAAAAIAFLAAGALALLSHRLLEGGRSLRWLAGADGLLALTHLGVGLRPLVGPEGLTLAINACAVGAFVCLLKALAEVVRQPMPWRPLVGGAVLTLAGQAWFIHGMPMVEARIVLFQAFYLLFLVLALPLLLNGKAAVPRALRLLIAGLLVGVLAAQGLRFGAHLVAGGVTPQIDALSVLLVALLGVLWSGALIAAEAARLRHALSQSEARLSVSIDTIPDPTAINRAADGVYVAVNPAFVRISGWAPKEILGRSSLEIGIWADPAARQALVARLTERPVVAEHQTTFRLRDGRLMKGIMSAGLIEFDGVPHIISITRDQTERLEREADLGRALDHLAAVNQELEHFTHAAAHDLKEPLRSIVSYSQILERRLGPDLPEERRAELRFIVDAGRRMHDLISGLDAYTRIDQRADPFRPMDTDQALADARANLAQAIAEAAAEISAPALPPVIGDPSQITQLFQNLLANALKFRRPAEPCRVSLAVAPAPDPSGRARATFSVSDNGIGFDPAQAERVFEVFTRLESGGTYPGSGMGLSICRRIVERHGGTISAEAGPGQGCTIRFTLPLAKPLARD